MSDDDLWGVEEDTEFWDKVDAELSILEIFQTDGVHATADAGPSLNRHQTPPPQSMHRVDRDADLFSPTVQYRPTSSTNMAPSQFAVTGTGVTPVRDAFDSLNLAQYTHSPTKADEASPTRRSSPRRNTPNPFATLSSDEEDSDMIAPSSSLTRTASLSSFPSSTSSILSRKRDTPDSSVQSSPSKSARISLSSASLSGVARRLFSAGTEERQEIPSLPTSDDVFGGPSARSFARSISLPERPVVRSTAPQRTQSSPGMRPGSFLHDLFKSGDGGVLLDRHLISHEGGLQYHLDRQGIAWGVQWMLHWGLQRNYWNAEDIQLKLGALKGRNGDIMHCVQNIMRGEPIDPDNSIGLELDREQAAIVEGMSRGLGLMGPWYGQADWYGGQVQQVVSLIRPKKPDAALGYRLQVEPMEKRRSTRLARYLGSRRVIQVRLDKDALLHDREGVLGFLRQKFVLGGRVFMAIPPKDDSLYLVEINEDFGRTRQNTAGDQHRMSYGAILEWHNPFELNSDQAIAKYFTRTSLALSTSVPALIFDDDAIILMGDIVSEDWDKVGKPPAEKVMTDGCGFINYAALLAIKHHLNYTSVPTAVQGRIAGAKGLWTRHPTDTRDRPIIWIRDSQNKIEYSTLDRAHRILDLLDASHPAPSSSIHRLSAQSIVNLSHNKVPGEVFESFMKDGLEALVGPLMDWFQPFSKVSMYDALDKMGSVHGSRMTRMAGGQSRALGLSKRQWRKSYALTNELDSVDDDESEKHLGELNHTAGLKKHSGVPLSVAETILEMVQANFHPAKLLFLWDKMRFMVDLTIKAAIAKYRIPIPEGQFIEGFVIPDPLDVLKPDQIYYRSSTALLSSKTHTHFNVITGPVVIGRYPIRLPSDIQKVTAVDVPALSKWPDVIIVSTEGSTMFSEEGGQISLMSVLSGGDMDGDDPFVCTEDRIVEPFVATPLTPPPKDLKDNFIEAVENATSFQHRIQAETLTGPSPREGRQRAQNHFMDTLLSGFTDGKVGRYSTYHDASVKQHGYSAANSIRLAYMGNTLLDAGKTGLHLKPEVQRKDQFQSDQDRADYDRGRTRSDKTFILDALSHSGGNLCTDIFKRYDQLCGRREEVEHLPPDSDLRQPYDVAKAKCSLESLDLETRRALSAELALIEAHVDHAYSKFKEAGGLQATEYGTSAQTKEIKKNKNKLMENVAAVFTEPVAGLDPLYALTANVDLVKASYAYHKSFKGTFAFAVAFQDLCHIKAGASPEGRAAVTRDVDEAKSIPSSYRKIYAR